METIKTSFLNKFCLKNLKLMHSPTTRKKAVLVRGNASSLFYHSSFIFRKYSAFMIPFCLLTVRMHS